MPDTPENLPKTPASGTDADAKRRAAVKAGLLAAPAILTLMARSSLALADNNGTPGAASAGSTAVARDNSGNHYGWDKNNIPGSNSQGNGPKFAADPKSGAPNSSSPSSAASSSPDFSRPSVSGEPSREAAKDSKQEESRQEYSKGGDAGKDAKEASK